MSLRQQNLGSIIKPGFNPLGPQTNGYTYYLYGWGLNNYGQIGLGNTTNYSSPKQVGSLTDWSSLTKSKSTYTQGAVKTDGTLWLWGNGSSGQLGLGNTTNYSSPKQVGALTNWLQVSGGYQHTIAVKTNGSLWAWGGGGYAQLGLGNLTSYSSPKQVGALTNWAFVAGGVFATMAVKTDGTLWGWGSNQGADGILGLGNSTSYSSPKQVGALTDWLRVYIGQYATVAVKTNGTLWSWGRNSSGQLGLNNTVNYSSPKQVGSLTTWLKAAANGYSHMAAVRSDGTLWTWGNNTAGQLGDGTTTTRISPVQVGSGTTWSDVVITYSSAGSTCAIKTDGTLWTWGSNAQGQLGLGNLTDYSSPKQVGSNTNWAQIGSSSYGFIALGY